MSLGVGKTSYSVLGGGAKSYMEIGPWNTTLTDTCTTAKETVGMTRQDGMNTYMYVQIGTAGATAAKQFVSIVTGLTDANGYIPPFTLSANGTASTGTIARGMTVCTCPSGGSTSPSYAWVLAKGITTAWAQSDCSFTVGQWVCPSETTANLVLSGAVPGYTGVGQLLSSAGTGTASAGAAGVLVFWNFHT